VIKWEEWHTKTGCCPSGYWRWKNYRPHCYWVSAFEHCQLQFELSYAVVVHSSFGEEWQRAMSRGRFLMEYLSWWMRCCNVAFLFSDGTALLTLDLISNGYLLTLFDDYSAGIIFAGLAMSRKESRTVTRYKVRAVHADT
jgi:hypothetical protein